jgi:hypothetical protein
LCQICGVPIRFPEDKYCEQHREVYVNWTCEGCGTPVTQHTEYLDLGYELRRCSQCQARDRAAQLSQEQREAILLALHQRGRLYAIKEARNFLNLSLRDAVDLVIVLE